MPRVMIWRFPDEEEDFVRYLESTGAVTAIPYTKARSPEQLKPLPLRDLLPDLDPDEILMGPAKYVAEMGLHEYEDDEGHYYIGSPYDGPVLVYQRGRLAAERRLTHSLLVGHWTYADLSGNRVLEKPEAFVRWGKSVFRWNRRATPCLRGAADERMTRRVAAAVDEGLELIP